VKKAFRDTNLADVSRRVLDLTFSSLGLMLLSPLILIIAIIILLETGAPVFFSQSRLGRNGRVFTMYKFRKFRPDVGNDGSPLTAHRDCRMTQFGLLLARSKLDELPQLWNVLRGEMSIVGPRPESLAFADCFANQFQEVLEHKPGILGPSQVWFRNESELFPANVDPLEFYRAVQFPLKAQIDLAYYRNRTLLSDLAWIARGVAAVAGWHSARSHSPICVEGEPSLLSKTTRLRASGSPVALVGSSPTHHPRPIGVQDVSARARI